jgi:hypothetical protein
MAGNRKMYNGKTNEPHGNEFKENLGLQQFQQFRDLYEPKCSGKYLGLDRDKNENCCTK